MLHGAAWAARRDRASVLVEDPQQRHLADWREQRTRRRAELEEKTARRQAEFTALLPAIAAQVAADVSAAVAAALQATRAEPLKELDLAPTTTTTSIISERAAATPSPTSAPASMDDLSPELDANTELTAPTPTNCLSKCQSHDASVSLSRLLSTTAPASSTTKGDVLSVFAAPMVGDKALEVDNTGDTAPTAAICLPGDLDHSTGGEDPMDMSLTPGSAPPSFNAPPEDLPSPLSAPMGAVELFMLSPSTNLSDSSGSSIMMFSADPTTRTSPTCLLTLGSTADVTAVQRHDLMSTLNKELKVIAEPIETGGMLTEAYQLFNEVPTVTEIVPWPPPSWPCARPPLIRGHDLFQHAQQRHGQEFSVTDSKGNWNAIWLRVELKPPWFFLGVYTSLPMASMPKYSSSFPIHYFQSIGILQVSNTSYTCSWMFLIVGHLLQYGLQADALLLLISGLHVPCIHFCVAQGYPRSDGFLDILNGEAVLQQSYSTSASYALSPFIQRGNTHFTKLMQWTFSHSLLQSGFRFCTPGHIFFFCGALEQWKILWMISLVSLKSCFLCCRDGCESLYSCKNFQWIIAWSLSNHSSLSSHQSGPIGVTLSVQQNSLAIFEELLLRITMGKLTNATILPMMFLGNLCTMDVEPFLLNCAPSYSFVCFQWEIAWLLVGSVVGSDFVENGIATIMYWPHFKLSELQPLHVKGLSLGRYPSVDRMMLKSGHVIQCGLELIEWRIVWSLSLVYLDSGNHSRQLIPAASPTYLFPHGMHQNLSWECSYVIYYYVEMEIRSLVGSSIHVLYLPCESGDCFAFAWCQGNSGRVDDDCACPCIDTSQVPWDPGRLTRDPVVYLPWDPGGLKQHRLEDKPNFKKGGLSATCLHGLTDGLPPWAVACLGTRCRGGTEEYIPAEWPQRDLAWNGRIGFGLHSFCLLLPPLLPFLCEHMQGFVMLELDTLTEDPDEQSS